MQSGKVELKTHYAMSATTSTQRFRLKHIPTLLKQTAIYWNRDDPWRLSAIVAYYAILALPGLLVVIISMLGYIWGSEQVEAQIYKEIHAAMGTSAADSMQSIFENAREGEASWIATVIGIGALVFGATGVFYHLQISINKVWEIRSDPKRAIWRYVIDRARSFGFVLIIAFLLLISFVVSAVLSSVQVYVGTWIPEVTFYLIWILETILSIAVISLLFALIFKYLPDVNIGWKSVWVGALITSILFAIGKELLSFYFGAASPGNVYGAAGSIIIVLLWVTYSSLILLFGSEFTWVFTKKYGFKFEPKKHAKYLNETELPKADL
jgi:membrane protein